LIQKYINQLILPLLMEKNETLIYYSPRGNANTDAIAAGLETLVARKFPLLDFMVADTPRTLSILITNQDWHTTTYVWMGSDIPSYQPLFPAGQEFPIGGVGYNAKRTPCNITLFMEGPQAQIEALEDRAGTVAEFQPIPSMLFHGDLTEARYNLSKWDLACRTFGLKMPERLHMYNGEKKAILTLPMDSPEDVMTEFQGEYAKRVESLMLKDISSYFEDYGEHNVVGVIKNLVEKYFSSLEDLRRPGVISPLHRSVLNSVNDKLHEYGSTFLRPGQNIQAYNSNNVWSANVM
jgi:hypothetical protein